MIRSAFLTLVVAIAASGSLPAQEVPDGVKQSGSFYLQQDIDGFTDEGIYAVSLINEDADAFSDITSVTFSCSTDGESWAQLITGYVIGRDNKAPVQSRVGGGEVRMESGLVSADNKRVQFEWGWADFLNLRNDPRVSVRVTDPADSETVQKTWSALEGVDGAIAHLEKCGLGGGPTAVP